MNLKELEQRKQELQNLRLLVKRLELELEQEILKTDAKAPKDLREQINEKIGSVETAATLIKVSRATLFRWLKDGFPRTEQARLKTLLNYLNPNADAASA